MLAFTDKFAAVDPEDDTFVATSSKAGAGEIVQVRSLNVGDVAENVKDKGPPEEQGNLDQIEVNYV